jgi:glycerol uptake facilitator-like aquaporin
MFFIMKSLRDKRVPDNIFGFVIGGYYGAVEMAFDKVTGGPMNPARVFGPAIFSGKFIRLHVFSAYIVAPAIGNFGFIGRLLARRDVLQLGQPG